MRRIEWQPGWRWGAAGAVLALACVAFFWRALLVPGMSMPRGGGDYAAFYYPYAVYAARSLAAGSFPTWSPQNFGGMPFAADPQHGLFYPANLLCYLLSPELDYGRFQLLTIGHYWLASLAATALLRGLGAGWAGALLGGVCYAYGGFMVAHFGHPPMVAVAAWMPLALLAALHVARAPAWPPALRAGLLAGATLGVAFLAGHAQVWVYGALAFAALLAAAPGDGTTPGRAALVRRAAAGGLALVLALGLAAVQLLPFLELAGRSIRAELTYERSLEFALHPVGLVQLLLPKIFGDSPQSFWGPWAGTDTQGYAGVVTLLLVGAALLHPSRAKWALVAIGGAGVLLALGGDTPLHGWAYRVVPGLSAARAAGRALYLYNLAVAILAGLGLDAMLRHPAGIAPLARFAARVTQALWLFALPLLYVALLLSLDRPVLERVSTALRGAALLALLLAGAAVLLWALRTRRIAPPAAAAGLAALAVIDLFAAGMDFNPASADLVAGYRHAWAFKVMPEPPGSFRIDTADSTQERWQPAISMVHGPPDAGGGWNPLLLADYQRIWTAIPAREAALYDLFAVRYLVIPLANAPDPGKFTLVGDDGQQIGVYRNERALPRAFVVPRARVLPREQIFEALTTPGFDPRAEVLLEEGAALDGTARGEATIIRADPAHLAIRASADAPAYLVISDSFYPGWQATINGMPAPILRANYALQALALPAGTHTIELVYRPWRLYQGAALSAVALVGLVVGLAATRVRRAA